MDNRIYFIAHYDIARSSIFRRRVSGAAVSKVDYIVGCLRKMGYSIVLLSIAGSATHELLPEQDLCIEEGYCIKARKAYPRRSFRSFAGDSYNIKLFLRKHLSKLSYKDIVICYHATDCIESLVSLKRKYNFKLILEVEEVYSDVAQSEKLRLRENSAFDAADAFLLATELLVSRVNPGLTKPCVVCSGVYRTSVQVAKKREDRLIHVVYAGTLDPRKGGAAAAAAAAFLDERYAMHILGDGSSSEVAAILSAVADANAKTRGCRIVYEGYKSGIEFTEFIQSCHIGLSPQNPNAAFNSTSFPSKVFMYLSNGLEVVSVDLPVFSDDLRGMLTLVSGNDPAILAAGVERAAASASERGDVAARMRALDEGFSRQLEELLERL